MSKIRESISCHFLYAPEQLSPFFEWTGPTDNIPFLLCATLSYHGSAASKGKNKGGGGKIRKKRRKKEREGGGERGWVGDMKERRKEGRKERREGKGEQGRERKSRGPEFFF